MRWNTNHKVYLGLNEEPTPMVRKDYGASIWKGEFDEADRMIRDAYYIQKEEELQQVVRKDLGYSAKEDIYDKEGFWIKRTYLNSQNEPVINRKVGYAILEQTYNENGRLSKYSYYIKEGEPIDGINHYAQVEYEYYDSGEIRNWSTTTAAELRKAKEQQEQEEL